MNPTFFPLAQPLLQILVLLGTIVVGYLHWRVESRLARFREDLMEKLNETFVSREVSRLQFDLIVAKLDALRAEVLVRIEKAERMAKVDRIRGSVNVPLTAAGAAQADAVGKKFAAAGGVHEIVSSDLDRAMNTSQGIAAHNPGAKVFKTPALHPWHLGMFEGQPTKDVLPKIGSMLKRPNVKAPGRSAASTAPGESFNEYKGRFLPHLRAEIADSAKSPGKKKILTTHYRGIKLAQAWAKAGAKADLSIDQGSMDKQDPGDSPGSIHHLDPLVFAGINPGKPTVNPATDLSQPGIYLVRHGATEFNGGS